MLWAGSRVSLISQIFTEIKSLVAILLESSKNITELYWLIISLKKLLRSLTLQNYITFGLAIDVRESIMFNLPLFVPNTCKLYL